MISSPSGGGKTTVFRAILKWRPMYRYSVSVTTRPPRRNETHGNDYFFISDDEFDNKIESGEFAEWAWVHGYRYGTLEQSINDALDTGDVIIFDLDVQGADSIKKAFPEEAILIFILPPSREELSRRLYARKTDMQDVIEQRIKNADEEVRRIYEYDYLVVNDALETCIDNVDSIISAELCRPGRILPIEGWQL